ncbi:MAG: hypothetical protein QOH60_1367 [Mycobacterium sp.]|nr:hypothetical protein [Mycobacterium sp.]
MTAINGLPAHVLLVHFLVVLAPLTALSEILCAVWPAARRRLVWPVLALALVTVVLTPITTGAGEWLYDLRKQPNGLLREHAELGGWMIYFAVAMLVVAIVIALLHVLEGRSDKRRVAANVLVAVVAVVVGISTIVTVYRIGDSGAQSVWGHEIARLTQANGG